jgi:hypothetical protein
MSAGHGEPPEHKHLVSLVDAVQSGHLVPGQHPAHGRVRDAQVVADPVRTPPLVEPQGNDPSLGALRQPARTVPGSAGAVLQPSPCPMSSHPSRHGGRRLGTVRRPGAGTSRGQSPGRPCGAYPRRSAVHYGGRSTVSLVTHFDIGGLPSPQNPFTTVREEQLAEPDAAGKREPHRGSTEPPGTSSRDVARETPRARGGRSARPSCPRRRRRRAWPRAAR